MQFNQFHLLRPIFYPACMKKWFPKFQRHVIRSGAAVGALQRKTFTSAQQIWYGQLGAQRTLTLSHLCAYGANNAWQLGTLECHLIAFGWGILTTTNINVHADIFENA